MSKVRKINPVRLYQIAYRVRRGTIVLHPYSEQAIVKRATPIMYAIYESWLSHMEPIALAAAQQGEFGCDVPLYKVPTVHNDLEWYYSNSGKASDAISWCNSQWDIQALTYKVEHNHIYPCTVWWYN